MVMPEVRLRWRHSVYFLDSSGLRVRIVCYSLCDGYLSEVSAYLVMHVAVCPIGALIGGAETISAQGTADMETFSGPT